MALLQILIAASAWSSFGAFATPSHLRFMSFYGMDAVTQHGWMNMQLEGSLKTKLDDFQKYQLPAFYGDLESIFVRRSGLVADWESKLETIVKTEIAPNFGSDKALRGVFFGDEICCSNVTCWETALAPVATKLRALLGPTAVLYTNECANHGIDMVPADLDLISVDTYAGYTPGSKGADEVTKAKGIFDIIFPKLHPHQQVMFVPGIFGCSNTSYMPKETISKNMVEKLEAYWEWAQSDVRVAGFNPWHYNNRSSPQHSPPCDMELGAIAYPDVIAKLQQIGKAIISGSGASVLV